MTAGSPGPWEAHVVMQRSEVCAGGCGYVVVLYVRKRVPLARGICTKCGHIQTCGAPPASAFPSLGAPSADAPNAVGLDGQAVRITKSREHTEEGPCPACRRTPCSLLDLPYGPPGCKPCNGTGEEQPPKFGHTPNPCPVCKGAGTREPTS